MDERASAYATDLKNISYIPTVGSTGEGLAVYIRIFEHFHSTIIYITIGDEGSMPGQSTCTYTHTVCCINGCVGKGFPLSPRRGTVELVAACRKPWPKLRTQTTNSSHTHSCIHISQQQQQQQQQQQRSSHNHATMYV